MGQTAIYGLPTIVGRLLNYFLVPLYTFFLPPSNYGVVSELYAWVAFLIVVLTFGMETSFFRFLHQKEDKEMVFRNSFLTVIGLNLGFYIVILFFSQSVADALLFSEHIEYIVLLATIVCIDAVSALPMAKLRAEEKSLRFATIHFTAIAVNVLFNLFFLYFFLDTSRPEEGVLFILIANLLSSLVKVVGTYKDYLSIEITPMTKKEKQITAPSILDVKGA